MQIAATPTFPVANVDKARDLLFDARIQVKGMLGAQSLGDVAAVRNDVTRAVKLLSTATNADGMFFQEMSAAVESSIFAVHELGTVLDSLKYIDNGGAFTTAFAALRRADAALDVAYRNALVGTHE